MRGLLIPIDGEPRPVEFTDWRDMARLIGAEYVEHVRVAGTVALYVDETGLYASNPRRNPTACLLYGTERHGQPIVGDALLVREGWTDEGLDVVDEDPDNLRAILDKLLVARAAS